MLRGEAGKCAPDSHDEPEHSSRAPISGVNEVGNVNNSRSCLAFMLNEQGVNMIFKTCGAQKLSR